MDKPSAPKREEEATAGEQQRMTTREQSVANRETWVRVRETITGEHEIVVHDREEAVALREEALRARAKADSARLEREHLLVQMREANEKLVVASLRADELVEQAVEARVLAAETATAETEGRKRAEELAEQLRASEQTLRDINRAKDDFLAILGHELRNPLAPILIALDLIAMDGTDSHEREHAIIERQVKHLVKLVDELLDTARIGKGKIELQRRPIELAEVVSRAVEMAGPLIESHGHVLSVDVPRRGLAVNGDVHRLAQVVGNLLINAAKFTPSGGAIVVTGERRDATVVLRVRDTGIGISKQMLPQIFDPYTQEHRETERVASGLGLGLAIVRSLVAMHGGTVSAHSEGLGLGTEFVVELPAVARSHEASRTSAAGATVETAVAHKILVVDDNRDAAELLAEAMTRLGHEVRVTFDGPSALEIARDFDPEVVLLDLGLPGIDGYEVARRLRASVARHIEIIAITAYGQAIDRRRSKEAGFDAHLVKPIDVATLQRNIDESWNRWH